MARTRCCWGSFISPLVVPAQGRDDCAFVVRFNGSTVIASKAKQSISRHKGRMDCFVAALLAMTANPDTTSRSRGASRPRFAGKCLTLQSEGAGNAGRPMRPIAACAEVVVESTRVSQVTPESPGTPRAMVLTVSSVLSPATGLSCHRRPRSLART
jgi:hypothetical protein